MREIPIRQIKPTLKEPKIAQTFRIRKIESLLGGRNMFQSLHRHNFFFVLALEKGKGKHIIDFIPYRVSNNHIFMLRPGQVHELSLNSTCTGFLLEFNMEFYHLVDRGTNQILRKATNANSCKVGRIAFTRLMSILQYIFREYQEEKDGYKEIIKAQLDTFFIEFARNRQSSKSPTANINSYELERLEDFLQLIETHISSRKQISAYADLLNMSNFQLTSITRRVLNKAPSEIINDYIILEAKRYLLATSDQVNQIAWHLGFEDPSYFIRFFRKHTGYSPEVFRSNSK